MFRARRAANVDRIDKGRYAMKSVMAKWATAVEFAGVGR